MGGAVSSGRDNNELVDNLIGGNYIRTWTVERVFRVLDRAEYMTADARDQAYKDMAWRNGPLHLSAPCIYSEVMEGLELRPGLSFLNVGSGTGYLSTLVGLVIGSSGISHGIEMHHSVVEYATGKLTQFMETSPTLDEFDFCEPKYFHGNGLSLAPLQGAYDRVYCGAGCPDEYQNYFKQLIKVGGVLVMPLNDNLVQVRRTSDNTWTSRNLLHVSFAPLKTPPKADTADLIKLEELSPPRLQVLSRAAVRLAVRARVLQLHPELRAPRPRPPRAPAACPRRICIPIDDDSDTEGLNNLHDLEPATGANEMNALLSLVLSMRQNRVAGALRFDPLASPSDTDSSPDTSDNEGGAGGGGGGGEADGGGDNNPAAGNNDGAQNGAGGGGGAGGEGGERGDTPRPRPPQGGRSARAADRNNGPLARFCRGILTLEYQNGDEHACSSSLIGARRSEGPPLPGVSRAVIRTNTNYTTQPRPPRAEQPRPRLRRRPNVVPQLRARLKTKLKSRVKSKPTVRSKVRARPRTAQTVTTTLKHKPDRTNAGEGTSRDFVEEEDESPSTVASNAEKFVEAGAASASTSQGGVMDWEDAETKAASSDDEAKETKRQKLDSGIGEETTPSSCSSPGKPDKDEPSDTEPGPSTPAVQKPVARRRRGCRRNNPVVRHIRGRVRLTGSRTASDRPAPRASLRRRPASPSPGAARAVPVPRTSRLPRLPRLTRRPRPRSPRAVDARRVRLAQLVARALSDLPLPLALQTYVNLGRALNA